MANQQTQKLTRAQIKAGLDTIPIESLLSSGEGKQPKLTGKQREFARALALGSSKAEAYRTSHKRNATPATMRSEPYVLAANPVVAREVEAYKLAIEAEKHRTPAQLKALLVQQLVQHSLDDDFPPASRVQCLKLLGSLFEVGAFVEHKQTTIINRSDDIRARLLSRLQTVTIDADIVPDDALDLLAEIRGAAPSGQAAASDPQAVDDSATSDPTAPGAPLLGQPRTGESLHTIPLKQSPPKSGGGHQNSQEETVHDFDE
jgi:hypothetical protein